MKPQMHDTVRTVEHLHNDGFESLIRVNATRTSDGHEAIGLYDPDREESLLVHSPEQAERLIRAIAAAARALEWDEPPTFELAQEAREHRRRQSPKPDGVSRVDTEFNYHWISANRKLAAKQFGEACGVAIKNLSIVWYDKEAGVGELHVWKESEEVAFVVSRNMPPEEANASLRAYLGSPKGVSFDFSRTGFVTVVRLTP